MATRQLTQSEVAALNSAADELGVAPDDLAAIIAYETGGTFDPWQKGPTTRWGEHRGLIQFGGPQRKEYGVYKGQSFEEQVSGPVVKYFKANGIQPGMGIPHMYSIVNAGSLTSKGEPRWGASDVPGKNIRTHAAAIERDWKPQVAYVATQQPAWAQNVDNSNPIRPVAYSPEPPPLPPLPRVVPRVTETMPPSPATLTPPTFHTASLTPDMPASMAPWNRTTATEVMPTVPKPASWNTSFPPQTNRQAQQDIISQMSPDWQQRAAQLGLGTAPPRTTPNVQVANVDPMVNQAADIYRQTMGTPMPGYLDAARESATYRPADMPSYTPASLVPPTPANRTPDTPATPSMPSYQPARMVPDTPARTVSDTPARQTAWDAPIPPSPFDQVASIAQPSVAAPARVSAPPALPVPDTDLTPWQNWSTGGADIVPARGGFDNAPYNPAAVVPPMPAPISTPTPATRTVTEQVINPEWQKWMDLQTAYPEAEGILAGLGPDTYLRTSRAEPDKWIVRDRTIQERNPYAPPKPPNTQLPFPNGVPPTRSPVQQFFHTVLDGAHSLGSGNMGAMGGLFGNMAMRSMLPVQSQTVGQNYGGYIPSKIYNTPTFNLLSGGSKYPYSVGTNAATGQSSGQYTVQKDDGSSVTYGTDSWPDSFSAPPNSTMYEVSWS